MKRDRRPVFRLLRLLDGVGSVAGRLPQPGLIGAGAACAKRNAVGRHERGVEADADLADQLGIDRFTFLAARAQRGHELLRTRFRYCADIGHQLLPAHTDTVVLHRKGAGFAVDANDDGGA